MKKSIKTISLLAGLTMLFTSGFAQKAAKIQFDKTTHDYGKIKEDGGSVTCTFIFKNTGDDTLKIVDVKPGCGCTTSNWTKTPVLPGKSGSIDATFDPRNRPGQFSKGITVTTNDPTQQSLILSIQGDVQPKVKTFVDIYPTKVGNLRMESSQLNLMNVNTTEIRVDTMKVYNDWTKEITIGLKDVPAYITVKVMPEQLKPGKEGLIIVTYDVSQRHDFGYVYDRITLATNDSAQADKSLSISLNIAEDFSKMTPEELANAPQIVFTNPDFDYGTVKQGVSVPLSFEFKNEGNSDLIIRKTKASCGCTASNPDKTILKKGEVSHISGAFNTTGKSGQQRKTITVISNDPKNPVVTLSISGTVEQ